MAAEAAAEVECVGNDCMELNEADSDGGDVQVQPDSSWVEVAMSGHGRSSTSWREERQSRKRQRKMSRWMRWRERGEVYSRPCAAAAAAAAGSSWLIDWLEGKAS